MLANAFATLTGEVFITGFALYLGMNDFMIGLAAAYTLYGHGIPAAWRVSRAKDGEKESKSPIGPPLVRAAYSFPF